MHSSFNELQMQKCMLAHTQTFVGLPFSLHRTEFKFPYVIAVIYPWKNLPSIEPHYLHIDKVGTMKSTFTFQSFEELKRNNDLL